MSFGTQCAFGESAQTAAPHGGSVEGSIGVTVGAEHCGSEPPPEAGLSGLPPLLSSGGPLGSAPPQPAMKATMRKARENRMASLLRKWRTSVPR